MIGWPVSHSRSPRLHNEWLRRAGIDGAYVPLPVPPGQLAIALAGLRAAGFAGVNVTIPHKEDAFRLCREHGTLSEAARRCGAVNTIRFDEDGWHGDATDGEGFLDSLRLAGIDPGADPANFRALLLGAGGAARSIAASLQERGVPVTLCNRTEARAHELAAALNGDTPATIPVRCRPWEERDEALREAALLINTTPLGMGGRGDALVPVDLGRARPELIVADIVYVPETTPLLADAARRGLKAVGGLGMLVCQGRSGFRRWFGAEPELDDALMALMREPG
ncbi:shikimate dehydrogenase [Rhizosaccharibacter radicis]|uniref:Shikimate dehydrogenase (NADP(+)) n=1 Tax=Rhizosaccharibacter radicis TaxID=2782605 RepID=A0ABT1VY10_9PROT|nr:shikimate dehydrogenase [Acetobacteraceae bacterium KSS12]